MSVTRYAPPRALPHSVDRRRWQRVARRAFQCRCGIPRCGAVVLAVTQAERDELERLFHMWLTWHCHQCGAAVPWSPYEYGGPLCAICEETL